MAEDTVQPQDLLGDFSGPVNEAIARLEQDDIVARIWAGDHTVWRNAPTEIENRLGWLSVIAEMESQAASLTSFASEIKDAGFNRVVLLGMGGSRLGPEVIRQVISAPSNFPTLTVLGSTSPSALREMAKSIDPDKTLFIVSSKSGGTIEPNAVYQYFRSIVVASVSESRVGDHFIAITDHGTTLESLANEHQFRRIFLNPRDIGGRYSVLSYFGLVPAALMGVDVGKLLARASMEAAKSPGPINLEHDSGTWLGAFLATVVNRGRDKLTVLTSPSLASFAFWVEQLLAESTGKQGTGLIPVVGEPMLEIQAYPDDRSFVFLRMKGDDNAKEDLAIERLAAAGHPVARLEMQDRYDIGGEFFRWELATSVAGAIMGIHPFDQPDVQAAKDSTRAILDTFLRGGHLPEPQLPGGIQDLLAKASPGDYLAIMVYAKESEGIDAAISLLRKIVADRYKIATTTAYGPRFLHSTGQLHKGGPATGLYLQLTVDETDLAIPGEEYGFGTLIKAQAQGDYQALEWKNRRLVRVHLGEDAESGILRLLGGL
jgi:glucose-6-phosphate isomerase/transaldolase/glucose-6-phosphate isomerase